MDTLILAAILANLLAIIAGARRQVVIVTFAVSLAAVLLLFRYHVSSDLPLNF